jgi:hypothetical protein
MLRIERASIWRQSSNSWTPTTSTSPLHYSNFRPPSPQRPDRACFSPRVALALARVQGPASRTGSESGFVFLAGPARVRKPRETPGIPLTHKYAKRLWSRTGARHDLRAAGPQVDRARAQEQSHGRRWILWTLIKSEAVAGTPPGAVSPRPSARACLARIGVDGEVGAFSRDREHVLRRRGRLTRSRMQGHPLGPAARQGIRSRSRTSSTPRGLSDRTRFSASPLDAGPGNDATVVASAARRRRRHRRQDRHHGVRLISIPGRRATCTTTTARPAVHRPIGGGGRRRYGVAAALARRPQRVGDPSGRLLRRLCRQADPRAGVAPASCKAAPSRASSTTSGRLPVPSRSRAHPDVLAGYDPTGRTARPFASADFRAVQSENPPASPHFAFVPTLEQG